MVEVSGSVAGKRQDLESTVSTLVAHVGEAIHEGSVVVQQTAETASTVLADITNAAELMQHSSYDAIDGFTSFLDGKGESLSTQLDDHFNSLQSSLSSAEQIVSGIESTITSHSSANENLQVVPTGQLLYVIYISKLIE